jgi:dTMP kinase
MFGVGVNTDNASGPRVSVGNVSVYIALEGVDGSGKSTVAGAVARRLGAQGHQVVVVREPGGTALGEAVRALLLDSESLDDWAEAFLFAAQRAELASEVVRPALAEGKWVISDRTYYSSIAYQGRARGLGEEAVRHINEMGLRGVVPDRVFILDVDPTHALTRQHRADRIGKESAEFQTRVREGYLALAAADPERVIVLEGSLGVDQMVDRIMAALP